MGRRSPRPISTALRDVRTAITPQTPLAAVQSVWREAVGEGITAAAEPTGERDGEVTIACANAVWANELELRQTELLARLRGRIEGVDLRGLRFVVAGDGGP